MSPRFPELRHLGKSHEDANQRRAIQKNISIFLRVLKRGFFNNPERKYYLITDESISTFTNAKYRILMSKGRVSLDNRLKQQLRDILGKSQMAFVLTVRVRDPLEVIRVPAIENSCRNRPILCNVTTVKLQLSFRSIENAPQKRGTT